MLSTYAIVGLCVVALAGASAKRLRRWAIAAYALAAIFYGAAGAMMWLWAGPESAAGGAVVVCAGQPCGLRLAMHPGEFLERGLAQTLAPDLWAHVLFGMWAARSGALVAFRPVPTADASVTTALACRWRHPARWGSILEIIAAGHGGWAARSNHDLGLALMTLAAVPVSVGAIWAHGWRWRRTWRRRSHRCCERFRYRQRQGAMTQFIGQSCCSPCSSMTA